MVTLGLSMSVEVSVMLVPPAAATVVRLTCGAALDSIWRASRTSASRAGTMPKSCTRRRNPRRAGRINDFHEFMNFIGEPFQHDSFPPDPGEPSVTESLLEKKRTGGRSTNYSNRCLTSGGFNRNRGCARYFVEP